MTAASLVGDVMAGVRAGGRNARTWGDLFTNTLKNADSTTYYREYSKAMGRALSGDPALIRTFTEVVDDAALTAVLKNADSGIAQTLVRNMDDAALARVAAVDPALARSLDFANVRVADYRRAGDETRGDDCTGEEHPRRYFGHDEESRCSECENDEHRHD
jgi:hypothetical protein